MLPPPPIAASVYALPKPQTQQQRMPADWVALQRKEQQLQEDLQSLLDAQAEGLIAGLNSVPDDQASDGSSTPTAQSVRLGIKSPSRRVGRRKPGLRAARRSISRTIQELAYVKAEERNLLENDLDDNRAILNQVASWEDKQNKILQKITSIEQGNNSSRSQSLQQEADRLQIDIHDLELRLTEMKAKHRRLIAEISGLENSVQSKLSSFKASLSLLDGEIRRFLDRPPTLLTAAAPDGSTFLTLPPKRRTLSMAKDHWQAGRQELEQRYGRVELEREALEEGAVVWKSVVDRVAAFEMWLADEMRTSSVSDGSKSRQLNGAHGLSDLVTDMDDAIQYIEGKLELAETRNWKLLECCIGAELEAFRRGRQILQQPIPVTRDGQVFEHEDGERASTAPPPMSGDAFSPARKKPDQGSRRKIFHSDDDEPDPELLISHQDTDTESERSDEVK
ncbi:hypothetical protein W97_01847 [Coniosporium apollinis CBS 100218]|uniref:Autophagy-related protein 28 n=1 Tax=Coniosporium apollinis (strain CBS 100218) TaxID=1168221 RepID=R7YL82_CONA1|nr:uncharacterized protein W97_01847 [Coniosporium apollinis CBS 100218]EON62623.1 hypothetical protein W97_01847 [Coniosporium apollinis CBS 100218]